MNRSVLCLLALAVSTPVGARADAPEIRSMSALTFGPEGILFVGDGKSGAVFALELSDRTPRELKEPKEVPDVEGKLAALLGATPADVLVHDLAVNPISKNIYLAVSRGRAGLGSRWSLPNDAADASVLVRVDPEGRMAVVDLAGVRHTRAALPNPVDAARKHHWKEGVSARTESITDLAFADGKLWVAGLSNEEFAATFWQVAYPFGAVAATTVENYHAAHGKYETESPVRAFLPYPLQGKTHLLAAYLCTPLVTFPAQALQDRKHVRGRTIGEFGSGNYPLDMVLVKKAGRDKLVIANSNLPLMVVDPQDVEAYEGELVSRTSTYTAGVRFESRSGTGIQQLDNLGADHVVVLQRLMSGRLDLAALPVARF